MYSVLPDLLYLGDVPVEPTVYGSALLYRLLRNYPPARLLILEANPWRSRPDRRLTSIRYGAFPLGNQRLLNSRLHTFYGSWVFRRLASKSKQIDGLLNAFNPQAVLTVTHGFSWLAAAEYAYRKKLPLHLILHDEWPGRNLVFGSLRRWARRALKFFYARAASRLCISPLMASVYQEEFGWPATVLYPSSDPEAKQFCKPPEALMRGRAHPVLGFGGTVSGPGQARVLRSVAKALAACGGKLVVHGPLDRKRSLALGLDLPNIELAGLASSDVMRCNFRNAADGLIIPMSFLEADRRQTIMSFPSKIADYAAAGLPLIIVAPEYSSIVQWGRKHQAIGEIVVSEDPASLREVIDRLASSHQQRLRLATRALELHQQFFSPENSWRTFCGALEAPPRFFNHTSKSMRQQPASCALS